MTATSPKIDPALAGIMRDLGLRARAAARVLARATTAQKNQALRAAAAAIRTSSDEIIAANARDMEAARARQLSGAMLDRLLLDAKRVEGMARSIDEVIALPDPVGQVMAEWSRPNGLVIQRVRVPLGVIGIIYESRPNVTADAGALCLKSGNAVILRGGSESFNSSSAIQRCLQRGLAAADLPPDAIQMVPTTDREAVGYLLANMQEFVDVVVPRGGKSLIERVLRDARVPVIGHLEGICHTYVHASADVEMAKKVTLNAKMRRTGICGATETLLIDRACLDTHYRPIADALAEAGCELRGDREICARDPRATPATEEDWRTEYLDSIIAVRVVSGVEEAIDHITRYGSGHTEAICTDSHSRAERWLNEVDASCVMVNASTRFNDGGELGLGAEIGISTTKMHAYGPMGLESLTAEKWIVLGQGQTRR